MSKPKKKTQVNLARVARGAVGKEKFPEIVKKAKSPSAQAYDIRWLWVVGLFAVPAMVWAYWPTFVWMEEQWRTEPDYSHGYLVAPLALSLLYFRRHSLPSTTVSINFGGLSLLVLAIGLRILGRFAYMDFLDGWTLVPWVAGLVWMFCGWRTLLWASPAIVFLLLLVPLPYRAESLLSFKLQGIATTLSTAALQILGLPAIPEGNTIWLGEQQLMVEEACSGLRIFVGMAAMVFYFAVLAERSWLDRVVIIAAGPPIAILVNVVRVTGTGIAYHWLSGSYAKQAHDLLGVLMIVLGAGLVLGVKQFWEALYRPLDISIMNRQLTTNLPP